MIRIKTSQKMDAFLKALEVHLGTLFGSLGAHLDGFGSQKATKKNCFSRFLEVQVFAQETVLKRFWAPSWVDLGRVGAQPEAHNWSKNG